MSILGQKYDGVTDDVHEEWLLRNQFDIKAWSTLWDYDRKKYREGQGTLTYYSRAFTYYVPGRLRFDTSFFREEDYQGKAVLTYYPQDFIGIDAVFGDVRGCVIMLSASKEDNRDETPVIKRGIKTIYDIIDFCKEQFPHTCYKAEWQR